MLAAVMRVRFTGWMVAAAALGIGACSLGGLDGYSAGAPPEGPPAKDASGEGDASAEGSSGQGEGQPNIVPNPGFEAASGGECGDPFLSTVSYNSRSSAVTLARAGSYACRVCNVSGASGDNYTLDPFGYGFSNLAVGRYAIEAWARSDDGGPSVSVAIGLRLLDGEVERTFDRSPAINTSGEWTRIYAEIDVKQAGMGELLVVSPVVFPRACFIVDDLALRHVP